MVIVSLYGGLGNQMFQYALARCLSHKLNTELKYDYSFNLNRSDFNPKDILFIYDIFNLQGTSISNEEISKINDSYFIDIQENSLLFDPNILSLKGNIFLRGYWQSEKYFKEISNIIMDNFKMKKGMDYININLAQEIQNTESVGIHLRGRDYLNRESTSKIHNTCNQEYYKRAIELIAKKIRNPFFYIFSDDPEWAESFLKNINFPYKFVKGNSWNTKSYEDMRLMSMCKHNIIANSSFSWWSAWLNSNPHKCVVAPQKWFAVSEMNKLTLDLVPNEWLRI